MMIRIVLWVLILCPMSIRAGNDHFIDYLYIEAGEGDSSGGHAAVRLGGDVFHYQYFNGLLKAVRQTRSDFEYQYRFLGNRTIHVSRIAVREATYQDLLGYFTYKHLVQSRQFAGLNRIKKDIALIRKLAEANQRIDSHNSFRYRVKGAALFSTAEPSKRSDFPVSLTSHPDFGQMVRQEYGPTFVADRKAHIQQALAGLEETAWTNEPLQLSPDRYPVLPYSLADRFADLLANLNALDAVQYGGSLKREAWIESKLPGFKLEAPQIEALKRYRDILQQDLLKLIASPRPDWGYPLLVGLARLMILDESIRRGRLVLLDTFRTEPEWVDPEDIRRYRKTFEFLLAEAETHFENAKSSLLEMPAMNEAGYSLLEMAGNQYSELARGVTEGKFMRIHRGDLAPSAMGDLSVSVLPKLSRPRLLGELRRLSQYAAVYSERLKRQYRYHLVTHNCVSEIFQDMERALSGKSEAAGGSGSHETELARGLGGYTDRSLWNSVPFISSAQVQKNLRVSDSGTLLSYRQNRLQQMYAIKNPLITYFRESNVLTSTLYPWNPDDGFFLFFTDDSILLRPVFGAFNVAAGIGQMLVGGVLSPFAGGDVFIGGVKGFLSSLPELSFFNIRKGSYRYQPFDYLMNQKTAAF